MAFSLTHDSAAGGPNSMNGFSHPNQCFDFIWSKSGIGAVTCTTAHPMKTTIECRAFWEFELRSHFLVGKTVSMVLFAPRHAVRSIDVATIGGWWLNDSVCADVRTDWPRKKAGGWKSAAARGPSSISPKASLAYII